MLPTSYDTLFLQPASKGVLKRLKQILGNVVKRAHSTILEAGRESGGKHWTLSVGLVCEGAATKLEGNLHLRYERGKKWPGYFETAPGNLKEKNYHRRTKEHEFVGKHIDDTMDRHCQLEHVRGRGLAKTRMASRTTAILG